mmetsp:Transcript_33366/g.51173  ORF Transcript_33366/g.51173 Transcript_33366/m.51173 type:complete len:217 (-) Transcript_33366:754-1404(-)
MLLMRSDESIVDLESLNPVGLEVSIEALFDGALVVLDVQGQGKDRVEVDRVALAAVYAELAADHASEDVSYYALLDQLELLPIVEAHLSIVRSGLQPLAGHSLGRRFLVFDFLAVAHVDVLELLMQFIEDEYEELGAVGLDAIGVENGQLSLENRFSIDYLIFVGQLLVHDLDSRVEEATQLSELHHDLLLAQDLLVGVQRVADGREHVEERRASD